jgi:3-oxoacyl-[acyl-carrier protein] reductase
MQHPARVALVTGGAGAIGRAIGERLARDGIAVALADLNVADADAAAAPIGGLGLGIDVTNRRSIDGAIENLLEHYGRLDIVVNNAGLNRRGTNESMDLDDWNDVLEVNLGGAFQVTQAAIPWLKRSSAGRIVNIASRVWLSGSIPAYTASKAGIIGLTRSLARELAPWGVTANAVAPSMLATPFTQSGRSDEEFAASAQRFVQQTPLARLCTPADVAGAVAFFAGPDAAFVTGEVLHVAGGSQMAPGNG